MLVYLANRRGDICAGVSEALGLPKKGPLCVALAGGGGKTSTMLQLAREGAAAGKRVIVTTTTHIRPPEEFPLAKSVEELETLLRGGTAVAAGVPAAQGKLRDLIAPDKIAFLRDLCDLLLVEADGSRGLPAKAPAEHEPVLPDCADWVLAVQGLSAVGGRIGQVCHRPERAAALLGKSVEDCLTPADCAALLTDVCGQRKGVGARRFGVVLNQADTPWQRQAAARILELLAEDIPAVVTAYRRT